MRVLFLSAVFCAGFAISAYADHVVFPPDDCSKDNPFMSFNGVNSGDNTYCSNGQAILMNAMPNCTKDQALIFDGLNFSCHDEPKLTAVTVYSETLKAAAGGSINGQTVSVSCPAKSVGVNCVAYFVDDDGAPYHGAEPAMLSSDRLTCSDGPIDDQGISQEYLRMDCISLQ